MTCCTECPFVGLSGGGAREASTGTLPGVIVAARIVSTPGGKTTGDALDLQPGKPLRPEQLWAGDEDALPALGLALDAHPELWQRCRG
jgi:hypothetical protein